MHIETIFTIAPAIFSALAVWVSINTRVAKVEQRLRQLEIDRDENKGLLKEVREAIEEIRILLARQGNG